MIRDGGPGLDQLPAKIHRVILAASSNDHREARNILAKVRAARYGDRIDAALEGAEALFASGRHKDAVLVLNTVSMAAYGRTLGAPHDAPGPERTTERS